ncbi:MAG: SAF domain-containing protein [Ilumatobacteraceae bacterium]
MSAAQGKVRSRVRTQWLALGAALVVLAGVLVAWALSNAADRVQVVQVAQSVQAGDVITAADLTVTGVAYDSEVQGLVPAESRDALVGRVAAIDLQAGAILQTGMWRDAPQIAAGEESVGALLKAGRFPAGLARGDIVVAAPIDAIAGGVTTAVRVIDVVAATDGDLSVTLAVPAQQSVAVAQLAATDQLLLVGRSTATDS